MVLLASVDGDSMSPEQELAQDLLAIVSVFGARLPGLRPYKKVLKEAALRKEEGSDESSASHSP